MTSSEFESAFAEAGVRLDRFPHVLGSAQRSEEKLVLARKELESVVQDGRGCAVLAFGSLGRMELTCESDLDVALVFDSAVLPDPAKIWSGVQTRLSAAGFKVFEKTFGKTFELSELITNVGGDEEKNIHLTLRVLLLTEGEWLGASGYSRELHDRLVGLYSDAVSTRGRYLTSLSNDLHRYYRTLCVDFHHKVERGGKPWGIRNIKLRHSRKLWHLGNICLESSAFLEAKERPKDYDYHVGYLSQHLRDPPLMKLLAALRLIRKTALVGPVLGPYDRFLRDLDNSDIRAELEAVKFEKRDESPAFCSLKKNADDLNHATIAVVRALLAADCGDHLIRFGVL